MTKNLYEMLYNRDEELKNLLYKENKKLKKIKKYIKENFTNKDGTIWNSDIKKIYEIIIEKK